MKITREYIILLFTLLLGVVIACTSGGFFSFDNLQSTVLGIAINGIVSIGMLLTLISGGFDLSVAGVLPMSGALMALLMQSGMNPWLAALIGILSGLAAGLITGLLISRVGIDAFMTTLGMLSVTGGVAFVLTQGAPLPMILPTHSIITALGQGAIFKINVTIYIMVILALIFGWAAKKLSLFRKIYYVGSNRNASILSGISAPNIILLVYTTSAVLAAISGVLTAIRFSTASPVAGANIELTAIAACIIGGASLSGGEGSVLGAIVGSLLLGVVNDALVLENISVYWQSFVSGIVLIVAVGSDIVFHKNRIGGWKRIRKTKEVT